MNDNEINLHSIDSSRFMKDINHLNESQLIYACQKRLKDLQICSIIRELSIYFLFLTLICLITYSNREQNSFLQVQH
jgi:hypothetical protein